MGQESVEVVSSIDAEIVEDVADLNCRAIKFKNGEEMICGIMDFDLDFTIKKYITVYDPMLVERSNLRPWSEVSDDTVIEISTDMIRAMYSVKDEINEKYMDLLAEQEAEYLRALLAGEGLTPAEREQIEYELASGYTGEEPIVDDPVKTKLDQFRDLVVTSKYIH